jgi:hypothetical protein
VLAALKINELVETEIMQKCAQCARQAQSTINPEAASYFSTPRLISAARKTSMRSRLTPKSEYPIREAE